MSNYSKLTNFATKDSLASGNPLKVIKGTEIDDEFEAIETSIGTKADLASPTFTGTPTAPTAASGTNSTQIATCAFVQTNGVPSGVIAMWSGTIATIPTGWYLCDGTNSTPDLTSRFVIHADADTGGTYNVGDTGGSASSVASHTHSVTDPGHNHDITRPWADTATTTAGYYTGQYLGPPQGTTDPSSTETTGISIGTTGTSDGNLPPYYALAYIMKG